MLSTRTPIVTIVLLALASSLTAQWQYSGNNTYFNSGNVGIGTTSPLQKFRVEWGSGAFFMLNGSTGVGDLFGFSGVNGYNLTMNSYTPSAGNCKTVLGINYSINGTDGSTQYVRNGSKKGPVIIMDADNGFLNLYGESGSGGGYRSPTLNLGVSVSSGGNVGIGTSAPSQKLDVTGTIKVTGFLLSTGAAAGKVLTSDANGNATWQTPQGAFSGWALGGNATGAADRLGRLCVS